VNIKDKIRDICTYHTKGTTSGYLLDEDRFAQIFALLDTQQNINQPIGSTTDFVINLDLKGKITQKHAQEIEEIIYEKLLDGWNAGFRSGKIKQRNEIDEALRLYKQEYANKQIDGRPNGWTVLEDIKKINK